MTDSEAVLITGAAGFIGSHLAELCLSRGLSVIAIDDFTNYYDPKLKRENVSRAAADPDYQLVEGDLLDVDLQWLVQNVSTVFHLAAQPGVRASWDQFGLYVRQNLEVTRRLLEASRAASLRSFVLASSSSIYGDAETLPTREDASPRPVSPYGVTKVAAEHLAYVYWRNHGVPALSVRYFTVYGPRQRPDMAFNKLIANSLAGRPFEVYGDGNQTRDFTYVDDAAAGTFAAGTLGQPGSAYNIGGGSRRSMNDVFSTLSTLLGEPVARRHLARQGGDARDTAADISRAEADLGYRPSVTFEEGLAAQLDWHRDRHLSLQASL